MSKLQTPNTKLQKSSKLQAPMGFATRLGQWLFNDIASQQRLLGALKFGYWSFSGVWSLVLGS